MSKRVTGAVSACIAAALLAGAAYASSNPFCVEKEYFNEKEAREAGMVLQELYSDSTSQKDLIIPDGFGGTLVILEDSVYRYDVAPALIKDQYMDARGRYKAYQRRQFTSSVVTLALNVALFLVLACAVILYSARRICEYCDDPGRGTYSAEKCAAKICAAALLAIQLFHNVDIRYEVPMVAEPAQALASQYHKGRKYDAGDINKLLDEYRLKYEQAVGER